jgi:hypothetical protein
MYSIDYQLHENNEQSSRPNLQEISSEKNRLTLAFALSRFQSDMKYNLQNQQKRTFRLYFTQKLI